jgi:hypothetical protein
MACLTAAMVVMGALVALDLGALLSTPSLLAPHSSDTTASGDTYLVQEFYAAANAVLAGDSPETLAAIVAPNLETIGPADTDAPGRGQDGLTDHLTRLRKRGAIVLDVVRIMGTGNDIAALIETRMAAPSGTPASLVPPATTSQMVEVFRLEAGRIVAYWPGTLRDVPLPSLPALTVAAPAEEVGVSLARMELGPQTSPTLLRSPFPHVLLVESGALAVPRHGALAVALNGAPRFFELPASTGEMLLLAPGDALLVPADGWFELRNAGDAPAAALSLHLAPRAALFTPPQASRLEAPTLQALHDPGRVGSRVTWGNNVITESLAYGVLPDPDPALAALAALTVSGAALPIEPGEQASPLPPGDLRFVVVQAGTFSLAGSPSGMAPSRLYRAGEAIVAETGQTPLLDNAGPTRLDLLVLSVALERESGAG